MTSFLRSHSPLEGRILLVDDNKSGLAARKAVLEELGHRVAAAIGAEDALDQFAPGKFDLIITDFRMPKMDGVELIKRLRAADPSVPVIMLSGYVETLGLSESNTGADFVVCKSANELSNLIRTVNRILRKKGPASQRSSKRTKRAHA